MYRIDADLQDDISVIEDMVDQHLSGIDIVYGVRKCRKTDTRFKRWTGEAFYRVMMLLGVNLVFNHADYRLLSRQAIEALKEALDKSPTYEKIAAHALNTSEIKE